MVEHRNRSGRILRGSLFAAGLALSVGACGSDNGPPSSPSPNPGTGGTIAATITITSAGASPRDVTVPVGSRVTFVNNDSRNHDMESDPHPEHTQCPELGQAGFLQPGESRTTGNLNTARICGFHDHNLPGVASLQGTIRVQ